MHHTAVQFGAGNIGRGFIAQLFHESGFDVVFVDVAPDVVDALNAEGAYTIRIVGPDACDVPIRGVRAINGRNLEAVARELSSCAVASTAVGASALPHIAPAIAAGLVERRQRGNGPLNVMVCENLHGAGRYLRGLVATHLPPGERDAILADAGFVQAVVSRMVPIQVPAGSAGAALLEVRVESYRQLPVDATAIAGALPPIDGVRPVTNFGAYEARKLFAHNCGHATLGYLGHLRGLAYGYEALADSRIGGHLREVLAATGEALVRRFDMDPDDHRKHVEDLLRRFANVDLGDTCYRLARDPIRKLAPDDRLVGAARLCQSQDVDPTAVADVIGAAYRFAAEEDPAAVELQRRIVDEGLEAAMVAVSGIEPGEPLASQVRAAYDAAARHGA
ncbi:MAG TPA: hypothetical protein VLH79_12125 [Chthonomonadales bacterium]|nr:hypothetical protein [Chthonomonadales bacterium]